MTDDEVYRKHAGELLRYATFLVGPAGAVDVVADACLAAFGAPSWPEVTNPRAYLYRAVLNAARQSRRETERRWKRELRAASGTPDTVIDAPDVRVAVLRAVHALSLQQRSVVFFTYWHDLSPTEIARHLGISTRTVHRDLARAHRKMEAELR